MVFPRPHLLPPSQALHPGHHGSSGEPCLQQQEDRTYHKNSPPVVYNQCRQLILHDTD